MNQILETNKFETLEENELVNINGGVLIAIIGWGVAIGFVKGYLEEKMNNEKA